MKTSATRPPYRNETVYRSAERLLASRPTKGRKGVRRVIYFLLGLGCGLAVAAWWLQPAHDPATSPASERAVSQGPARDFFSRFSKWLKRSEPFAVPASSAGPPASSTAPSSTAGEASLPAQRGPAGDQYASNPGVSGAGPMPSAEGEVSPDTRREPTSAFNLTAATTHLKLRGELRSTDGVRNVVEFEFHLRPGRLGGTVQGVLRWLDGTMPSAEEEIAGTWLNRTFILKQEKWPSPAPAGFAFVIDFPEDASGEIKGYWTRGPTKSGTLTLKSIPPF